MDPNNQQQPVAPQQPAQPQYAVPVRQAGPVAPVARKQSWKDKIFHPNNTSKVIAISVIVAAFAVAAGTGYQTFQNGRVNAAEAQVVARDKYQAVFLTNGQVYFGKINDVNSSYVKLSDIYYLQQQDSADKTDQDKTQSAANPDSQANVSLAKLGNELHGPEDAMYINKDQVLFWENLKNDGKVSAAIAEYKKK